MNRRDFLKTSAAATTGSLILAGNTATAASANSKLNIALIGTWGRALAFTDTISKENIVALCDVDENYLNEAAQRFPKAKTYVDWRKCLEQKDIEAVIIATPDHTHAFIATWAMNRGMHVYCEKPQGNSVEEARLVRATYLKNKHTLATQLGIQRHAFTNFNRVRELIRDGAIGDLGSVHTWGNRQLQKDGYLPAKGQPPKTLHYDLWLGPSPHHPYNPDYFSGRSGLNCLQWNMYWDFGTGQVGDMGSHTMDLAWNAIDAGLPTSATAEGDPFNPEVTPVKLHMTFEHPANDWRGPVQVHWHQGGAMPLMSKSYPFIDLNKIGHGAMFKGSEGFLITSFDNRIIIPVGKRGDLTYYTPRTEDTLIPPLGHFMGEWINACKGDLKTSCDFDYGGKMTEQMMLGLVAYRVGQKIQYDGQTGRVTDCSPANELLKRQYRPGWTLNG